MQFVKNLFTKSLNFVTTHYYSAVNAGFRLVLANRYFKFMRFFVKLGADVNQLDNEGRTPLSWAARNGHIETVKALLKAGANVNQADRLGETPLYWAALNGHIETVKALLKAGAHVNQANRFGHTPFSFFIQNGCKVIIKLSLIHNEDLLSQCRNIKSDYGKKPIVQKAIAEIDEAKKSLDEKSPFTRVRGLDKNVALFGISAFLNFKDAVNLSKASKNSPAIFKNNS